MFLIIVVTNSSEVICRYENVLSPTKFKVYSFNGSLYNVHCALYITIKMIKFYRSMDVCNFDILFTLTTRA
jgi:hypothetical protein